MSFIPSMLKSAPQVVSITISGANYIADSGLGVSVDPDYSAIALIGLGPIISSPVIPGAYLKFLNGSTVRATRLRSTSNDPATQSSSVVGLVFEFVPQFLRQAVSFITLPAGPSPYTHGLTLGPKFFGLCSGWAVNSDVDPTGLSIGGFAYAGATTVTFQAGNVQGIFIVDPR